MVANLSFVTALLAGAVAIGGDCLATLPVLQGLLSQTRMRRAMLKVLLIGGGSYAQREMIPDGTGSR